MKKFLLPILVIVTAISMSSCNNDDDDTIFWDFGATTAHIYFLNDAGQNLLNDQTEGNILNENITLTYNGITSDLIRDPFHENADDADENADEADQIKSRFLPAIWSGVYLMTDKDGGRYLCVGDWQTEENFNHDFVLTVGSRNYSMNVNHTFKFKRGRKDYEMRTLLKVNGKEVDSSKSSTVTTTIIL